MTKYVLRLTAQDGKGGMTTELENTETGYSVEEMWTRIDGVWVWETSWSTDGGEQETLYWTLNGNDARTDELLNELEASFYNKIEFEA